MTKKSPPVKATPPAPVVRTEGVGDKLVHIVLLALVVLGILIIAGMVLTGVIMLFFS